MLQLLIYSHSIIQIPCRGKLNEIVDGFETFWGFTQAAEAIDGSIIQPEESASHITIVRGITPSLYKPWWIISEYLWTSALVGQGRSMMPEIFANLSLPTIGGEILPCFQNGREPLSGVEVHCIYIVYMYMYILFYSTGANCRSCISIIAMADKALP